MNGIRRFGPLTIFVAEPLLSEQEPLERREKANSSGARFSENRNPHHEATGPHSENPAYRAVARRIKNWPLMSLQQRLVKTGGRRIKHARYYWLRLAESHLTRRLFGGMLRRIAALPSLAGQASRRPKQLSALSETGEGKAFEEWVGEASVFGLEIFAAAVGKALHSKTWLDHCILTGVGVLCRSARKVKMENHVNATLEIQNRQIAHGYKVKMGLLVGKIFNAPKVAVLVGTLFAATVAVPALNRQLVLHAAPTPVGKAEAGKAFWQAQMCQYCHGVQAEGAWGPDLAARGLSEAQIKHALRQPYGLMPAYVETQVSEQTIADLQAFFSTLPKAEQFGPWRWQSPPASAPEGQRLQSAFGCGQCHEPELAIPRRWLGGVGKDADFAYFSKQIYQHTVKYPQGRMGNFSEDRLPKMVLRVIYQFMLDAGFRAPINASLKVGAREDMNTTYALTVFNDGVAQRGLDAEDITIFLKIPSGTKFVSETGAGFKGVLPLAQLGIAPSIANTPGRFDPAPIPKLPERPKPDFSGEVAVWKVPRISAAETQTYTLTLLGPTAEIYRIPGPGPTGQVFKGFEGSTVYWAKPGVRMGPPQLVYRDLRLPDKGDQVAVTAAPQN